MSNVVKRQAVSTVQDEDPEKQHKEWKNLHENLARIARKARMVTCTFSCLIGNLQEALSVGLLVHSQNMTHNLSPNQ